MNFKTTYILFGTLVVVLGVFAATQLLGVKKPGQLSDFVLPSLNQGAKAGTNPEDFDAVEIARLRPQEEKLLFVKRAGGWEMEKPYRLHANRTEVDNLIRQVMGARRERIELDGGLKGFELDSPTAVVTLKKGGEREWKINLGRQSPGEASAALVYVTSSDRPKEPMAVKRAALNTLFETVNDFRSKDLLEANALNTTFVSLQQPKKESVVLEKNPDESWRFEKPAFGEADKEGETTPGTAAAREQVKPITGVRDLLETIGGLQVATDGDFGGADTSDADLAKFGLDKDNPAYLRIEIKRTPGPLGPGAAEAKEPIQDALLVGNLVAADKDDKKAGDQIPKRYVRLASEKAVAKVAAKNLDAIAKIAANPSVLRNRDLVRVNESDVDAIDIKNASGLLKIRGNPAKRKLYAGTGKPRGADDPAVSGLLKALTRKRQVKDFPDPAKEAEMGFDKPEAVVVSLWVHGIQEDQDKKEEKKDDQKAADAEPKLKDDKPAVKLTFGKEDKDGVFVRREIGDKKMLLTVPKDLLTLVSRGRLAYLDKTIPSFSAEKTEVTGVVLDRGGEVFDIEKPEESGSAAWKLKAPAALAGRNADPIQLDRIINELRGLRPFKLAAENAMDLDKYGLKKPQLKGTLKVKNKEDKQTEDWVYLFGKETEDKTGIYAKQEKHDLIFVVGPEVLVPLRGELQDPTVFRVDLNKLKEMKLSGWKKELTFTFNLILERQGPKMWTPKTPEDFDLDPLAADRFAGQLAGLRAERIIVRQKGPQPEHKLGDKDATLRIELTVEGEKSPLTLTIGALDAKEKAYYAQSSTMPGDVFLLSQTQFESVLAGPKYFSKKAEPAKAGK